MLPGSRFLVVAAATLVWNIAPAIAQPPNARSLADLLQEAEDQIATNATTLDASLSFQQAQAVDAEIVRIAQARNAIILQDGGLLKALADATTAQYALARTQDIWQKSAAIRSVAQAQVDNQQAIALRIGKQPLGLQSALDALNAAEQQETQRRQERDRRARDLSDLCGRLMRDVPSFLTLYDEFRRLLPHQRSNRNAWLIAAIVSNQPLCEEWVEGELILALALIYDGQDDKAEQALAKATAILNRYPALNTTVLAQDCCAAWLLLGNTRRVVNYVKAVEKIPTSNRTAMQCWLLGAYARMSDKRDQAAQQFRASIDKAGRNAPPSLLAEAALAQLVAGRDKKHVQYAAEVLGRLPNDESWPTLQSRAALAAAEERWDDAVALLDTCQSKAPPCLAKELTQQQEYYARKKLWRP